MVTKKPKWTMDELEAKAMAYVIPGVPIINGESYPDLKTGKTRKYVLLKGRETAFNALCELVGKNLILTQKNGNRVEYDKDQECFVVTTTRGGNTLTRDVPRSELMDVML